MWRSVLRVALMGLMLFGLVLLQRRRPLVAGIVLGIAASMKTTAWPLAFLALLVATDGDGKRGRRPSLFFLAGESGVRNSPCSALAGLPTTSRVAARLDAAAHEAAAQLTVLAVPAAIALPDGCLSRAGGLCLDARPRQLLRL